MKKTLLKTAAALCALVAIALVSCGGGTKTTTAAKDNILRVAKDLSSMGNLDVMLTSQSAPFETSDTITDTLIGKREADLALYPLLLEDFPQVSDDGLLYTFKLKKGVLFHNGEELKSDDVLFTFNRFFNPATQTNMIWLCDEVIKGAMDVEKGLAKTVSGIKKIDDYTFTIELIYPFSAFTSILAASPLGIISQKACVEAGANWGITTYVGTGSFKVESFEPKQRVTLARFDQYHGGKKSVDKIIITNMDAETALMEFESGSIDMCPLPFAVAPGYLKDPKFAKNVKYQEFMGIWALHFNMAIPPFNDIRVRKAIAYATDLNTLCNVYFQGGRTPANSLIPKGIPGYNKDNPVHEYNPEKAKQLLAEAGYANGLTFLASVRDRPDINEVFTVLQDQFKKSNITMNLEIIDYGSFAQKRRQEGGTQLYMITWYADYVDPDMYLYLLYHSSVSDNFANGFSKQYNAKESAWYDSQVEKGRLISSQEEKITFYADLERWLTTDFYAQVPLFCASEYYMVSDRVTGAVYKSDWLYSYENAVIQ
jgi:ABC-type transport system substrate-binding protein